MGLIKFLKIPPERKKAFWKFLIADIVILGLFLPVLLAPKLSNLICNKKISTVLVGTVTDSINSGPVLRDIEVLYPKHEVTTTDINGQFILKNITTTRSRFKWLGCQSCEEETVIKLTFTDRDNKYSFDSQISLDNNQITDTIYFNFPILLK